MSHWAPSRDTNVPFVLKRILGKALSRAHILRSESHIGHLLSEPMSHRAPSIRANVTLGTFSSHQHHVRTARCSGPGAKVTFGKLEGPNVTFSPGIWCAGRTRGWLAYQVIRISRLINVHCGRIGVDHRLRGGP